MSETLPSVYCVFCGKGSPYIERDPLNERKWYGWTCCDYCGAKGPVEESEDECYSQWSNAATLRADRDHWKARAEELTKALKSIHDYAVMSLKEGINATGMLRVKAERALKGNGENNEEET